MKTQKTKPQALNSIAKNLEPRDERDVKAGACRSTSRRLSTEYTPFDDQHK